MNPQKRKQKQRQRRGARVQVYGMTKRPRLSVFRSLKYIYAQIINDDLGKTLVSASTAGIKSDKKMTKTEAAYEVGKILAKKAQNKKINKVIFDRGRYKYHGRIKALAQGAREGGLEF